jgi:hypothetical protein
MISKSDIKDYIRTCYEIEYDFDIIGFTEEKNPDDGENIIKYTRTSRNDLRITDWLYTNEFLKVIRDKKLKRVV